MDVHTILIWSKKNHPHFHQDSVRMPSMPKLNIIETDLKVQVVFAVSIVCSKPQNVMIVAS